MLTPQQIQEIRFEKAVFGGYDMGSVDDFLEPLTEDYITLYKENSVLKSKMRILVEKLEEYRRQEGSMQNALLAAQKTCDQMIADTEKKCAKLLHDAEETASQKTQNADVLVGTEQDRLEAAQLATAKFIDGMEKRLTRQIELLEELRTAELPAPAKAERDRAFDFDKDPSAPTPEEKADALIEEISQNMDAACAEEKEDAPEASEAPEAPEAPQEAPEKMTFHGELPPAKQKLFHDLQFGRNYDPTKD